MTNSTKLATLQSDVEVLRDLGRSNLETLYSGATSVMIKTDHLQDIWSHSRSSWMLEHLTLSYHAPWKNLRQIAAEINAKQQAVSEAKFKLMQLQAEIDHAENVQTFHEKDALAAKLTAISVAQKKEQIGFILRMFEGALKEVADLGRLYDRIAAQIGDISEEAFNAAEAENHLRRAIVQSIRDVRQMGTITAGNQEYLEQIGAAPLKVHADIVAYLTEEGKAESYGVAALWAFVDSMVAKITADLGELASVRP